MRWGAWVVAVALASTVAGGCSSGGGARDGGRADAKQESGSAAGAGGHAMDAAPEMGGSGGGAAGVDADGGDLPIDAPPADLGGGETDAAGDLTADRAPDAPVDRTDAPIESPPDAPGSDTPVDRAAGGAGGAAGTGGPAGAGGAGTGGGGAGTSGTAGTGGSTGAGASGGLTPNGICSQDNWCWQNPQPWARFMTAVRIGASGEGMAVGHWGSAMRHRAGTPDNQWEPVPVPGMPALNDLWGATDNDIWAISFEGPMYHWDGAVWSQFPALSVSEFNAMWGSGANDIWAVGRNGVIGHKDATGWSLYKQQAAASIYLNDVWGTDANHVWAVGSGLTMMFFDGQKWNDSPFTSPFGNQGFSCVIGSSATDVWALGGERLVSGAEQQLRYHWNGSTWTPTTVVDGATPWRCIGGSNGEGWMQDGSLWHLQGGAWTKTTTTPVPWAFGGKPGGELWGIGAGLFMRYDGAKWVLPYGPQIYPSIWAVWSPGPASNDGWMVGNSLDLLRWNGTKWSYAQHYDTTTFDVFEAVHGHDASDVWAVGSSGLATHFDGTKWTKVDMNAPQHQFVAAYDAGPNDLWLGTYEGKVLRWNGTTLTTLPNDSSTPISEFWQAGPNDMFVLAGGVRRWNGTAWTHVIGTENLASMWGASSTDAWAVGAYGTIMHWTGEAFDPPVGKSTNLSFAKVRGRSANDIWASGEAGAVMHYDGIRWKLQAADPAFLWRDVMVTNNGVQIFTQDSGIMRHP